MSVLSQLRAQATRTSKHCEQIVLTLTATAAVLLHTTNTVLASNSAAVHHLLQHAFASAAASSPEAATSNAPMEVQCHCCTSVRLH
jgi:hypothetical protein